MKIKTSVLLLLFFSFFILFSSVALAHCPLCSVATGMAVATTRFYGIDDLVIGLFIGSFVVSTALWMNNFALKRNKKKELVPYQSVNFVLISLLLTLITLYFSGILGGTNYQIFGLDRIFLGALAGTFVTFLAFELHKMLRIHNGNRSYIPMQGIILPLSSIIILSLGLYLIGVI